MKVALCCIGRLENKYAIEYVEYYKSIGVDKIFIYDNNYNNEEYFEEVLQPYIDCDLVDVINFRDKSVCQLEAYQDCYDKHGKEYDWIAFFDFDEYLTFVNKDLNIKDYLSNDVFDNFDLIHINWMVYDDNDLVYYEDKPLVERFKKPKIPLDFTKAYSFPQNCHIKSIIRGKIIVKWESTPHTPSNYLKCCDSNGKKCKSSSPFVVPYVFDVAYIRHYATKTIEEFYTNKVKRGYPDGNKDFFINKNWSDDFFSLNKKTDEKMKYVEQVLDEKNKASLDIFICTHKDFDKVVNNNVYSIVDSRDIKKTYNNLIDKFYSELLQFFYVSENYKLKDYVGFCHYRRYFAFMDDIPNMDEVFKDCDIITARPREGNVNMREEYKRFHNIEDLNIIEGIIEDKFPSYRNAMRTFLYGEIMFPYNMFIMKREDFLEYINFIKSVLDEYLKIVGTDIVKRIEDNKEKYLKDFYPNNTIEYQYRIGGYLAERLTTVFILAKFKKVTTYKVIITEEKYKENEQ